MKKNMIWKAGVLVLALAMGLMMTACSNEAKATENDSPEISTYFSVDYGDSKIYSQEDLEKASLEAQFILGSWKDVEVTRFAYAGDDRNTDENIAWMNDLAEGQGIGEKIVSCACFVADFKTGDDVGEMTFNTNFEYKDYEWWVGQGESGKWYQLSNGYC